MMKSTTITFNQEDLQLLALAEVEKRVHPLPADKVTYEWDAFGELCVHIIEEIQAVKDVPTGKKWVRRHIDQTELLAS